MHIPDGWIDLQICAILYVASLIFWFLAFKRTKELLNDKQVPFMATLTAMFFAAQMMNYPIIGGTTAHLLGGPILAITLGPYPALISMTIILLIQALFFGDGGLLVFGANIWNMGVIGVFIPFITFLAVTKLVKDRKGLLIGAFLGAFLGDVSAAIFAGLELGLSTIFPFGVQIAVTAMAIHHSIIGIGEGLITALMIAVLLKARPDLLQMPTIGPKWMERRLITPAGAEKR